MLYGFSSFNSRSGALPTPLCGFGSPPPPKKPLQCCAKRGASRGALTPNGIRGLLAEHAPARRKSWAVGSGDEDVVVQIPDRCLTAAGIVKQIVRMAVPIKIRYSH